MVIMSRSYKKHPFYKDGSGGRSKFGKKFANKKVRNSKETFQHKDYKKKYCSWEINDYISRQTKEEIISQWEAEEKDPSFVIFPLHERFKTLEEALNFWEKSYRRK